MDTISTLTKIFINNFKTGCQSNPSVYTQEDEWHSLYYFPPLFGRKAYIQHCPQYILNFCKELLEYNLSSKRFSFLDNKPQLSQEEQEDHKITEVITSDFCLTNIYITGKIPSVVNHVLYEIESIIKLHYLEYLSPNLDYRFNATNFPVLAQLTNTTGVYNDTDALINMLFVDIKKDPCANIENNPLKLSGFLRTVEYILNVVSNIKNILADNICLEPLPHENITYHVSHHKFSAHESEDTLLAHPSSILLFLSCLFFIGGYFYNKNHHTDPEINDVEAQGELLENNEHSQ